MPPAKYQLTILAVLGLRDAVECDCLPADAWRCPAIAAPSLIDGLVPAAVSRAAIVAPFVVLIFAPSASRSHGLAPTLERNTENYSGAAGCHLSTTAARATVAIIICWPNSVLAWISASVGPRRSS